MKRYAAIVIGILILTYSAAASAEKFDATDGFKCDAAISGQWTYEAYRAEDGAYLQMIYDHAPITELSKYGIEARFLPDGDQRYYPYISYFPDGLHGSPATTGRRFDAVAAWKSPIDSKVKVTGFAELTGNIKGDSAGKKVRASLKKGAETLWSGLAEGGVPVKFSVDTAVSKGDIIRMHIENPDDVQGKLTLFNFSVETQ